MKITRKKGPYEELYEGRREKRRYEFRQFCGFGASALMKVHYNGNLLDKQGRGKLLCPFLGCSRQQNVHNLLLWNTSKSLRGQV